MVNGGLKPREWTMKKLWILALAAVATGAVVMASGPAVSSQSGDCGATFEIHDPELQARFAAENRSRNADFAQLCSAYRADLSSRRSFAKL
jgi:hypothetical protein